MTPELLERASRIRMLLMDVDGVLTNAKLYNVPGPDGKMWETKGFDAQDGIALQWMSWYGIETGVISGRVSPAVEERARAGEDDPRLSGPHRKNSDPRTDLRQKRDPRRRDRLYRRRSDRRSGDAPRLHRASPRRMRAPEVKKAAHIVTEAPGGAGAVREVCELLLQAHGKWAEILKKYEIE